MLISSALCLLLPVTFSLQWLRLNMFQSGWMWNLWHQLLPRIYGSSSGGTSHVISVFPWENHGGQWQAIQSRDLPGVLHEYHIRVKTCVVSVEHPRPNGAVEWANGNIFHAVARSLSGCWKGNGWMFSRSPRPGAYNLLVGMVTAAAVRMDHSSFTTPLDREHIICWNLVAPLSSILGMQKSWRVIMCSK
jgi:hypothetical protein